MKAPAFDYSRVSSVSEAVALLSQHGDDAKILAGGQSLMPALNLRLLAPKLLVDIGGCHELRAIALNGRVLTIGALARHVDVLKSDVIAAHAPLLSESIQHVAHPAIRNRGTFGGSLSHADPASELPACALALGATIIAQGPDGERRIAVDDFFAGIYETVLAPDEILVGVDIPVFDAGEKHFFCEHSRRKGDYALAGLAARATVVDGRFTALRLAFFAVGDRPFLANACAQSLLNTEVTADVLARAHEALDAEAEPSEDLNAPADMRLYLMRGLLTDCVNALLGRSDSPAGSVS